MSRLLVLCEGQTEIDFVETVLRWHLAALGYRSVEARLFGDHRSAARRGGIVKWPQARRDILRHVKQDKGLLVTTMVDYYGLPSATPNGWPGRRDAPLEPTVARRAAVVEAAVRHDLGAALGHSERVVPFVVLHEFEALLFSDCRKLAEAAAKFDADLRVPAVVDELERIRLTHGSPEEINDDPHRAPSKRIETVIPGYRKRLMGWQVAKSIGIPNIAKACPHFDSWIRRLGALVRAH